MMTAHFILKRRYFSNGTYATLHRQDGSTVCCMVERAWHNNKPNISCVPEGTYDLYPHHSPKFGHCYALEQLTLGVTRDTGGIRTHILIHKANKPSELQGCLAPGVEFGTIDDEWGVVNSTAAFNAVMKELNNTSATLTITKD